MASDPYPESSHNASEAIDHRLITCLLTIDAPSKNRLNSKAERAKILYLEQHLYSQMVCQEDVSNAVYLIGE